MDEKRIGEDGRPMLNFDSMEDGPADFNIDDRSPENEQKAFEMLKTELGPGYKSAIKNAQAVLTWADDEYPKSLEQSGLGNYPPLIKALSELGHKLEAEYREANKPGSMREASLKAFRVKAREKINHLISKVEADYIKKHGGISRLF